MAASLSAASIALRKTGIRSLARSKLTLNCVSSGLFVIEIWFCREKLREISVCVVVCPGEPSACKRQLQHSRQFFFTTTHGTISQRWKRPRWSYLITCAFPEWHWHEFDRFCIWDNKIISLTHISQPSQQVFWFFAKPHQMKRRMA